MLEFSSFLLKERNMLLRLLSSMFRHTLYISPELAPRYFALSLQFLTRIQVQLQFFPKF